MIKSLNIRPWERLVEWLPPLARREREALKESIKEYGVKIPILVFSDGLIIDGVNRWEICKELGIECPHTKLELSEDDAFALGVALNFARRQLSPEQIKEFHEKRMNVALQLRKQDKPQEEVARIVGVTQKTISEWENRTNIPGYNASAIPDLRISVPTSERKTIYKRVKIGEAQKQVAADYKISPRRVGQIVKLVEARENKPDAVETPPFPDKKYRCIVIDPPWPVKKIEREERPNQGLELDYPTMSIEEIEKKVPITDLANPEGCHVFLWVTHKFLPEGLNLFEKWGVKYQCILTWVKPTGMTPFSWMYNTEHVLFGRIGNLDLLKKGIKLSFNASVTRHSEKPSCFFDIVRQASPEPRLEMFVRQKHEGFDPWGSEAQ